MVEFPPWNFQQRYIELKGVNNDVRERAPPMKRCQRILSPVFVSVDLYLLRIFNPLLLPLSLHSLGDVTLEASSDEEVEGDKDTEPTHEVEWSQKTIHGHYVCDEGEFARQQSESNQ